MSYNINPDLLEKIIAQETAEAEPKNIPFTAKEIQEWKESRKGKKDTLLNTEPNRKARRELKFQKAGLPVRNNRGKCGMRVFEKMAYLSLCFMGKRMKPLNNN